MSGGVLFLCLIARYRSLRIAPGSRLLCRRSPTEERVGSLLRSAAARDPVRATTKSADSKRDARAALRMVISGG